MNYNPRDGKLWKESKRYKSYLFVLKIAYLFFTINQIQMILNFYNRINPPLPIPEF